MLPHHERYLERNPEFLDQVVEAVRANPWQSPSWYVKHLYQTSGVTNPLAEHNYIGALLKKLADDGRLVIQEVRFGAGTRPKYAVKTPERVAEIRPPLPDLGRLSSSERAKIRAAYKRA